MQDERIVIGRRGGRRQTAALTWVHTLVIGSGAAGLNAAVRLRQRGVNDLLILTEGLDQGTSINTGSDKQTYYKLALCGRDPDCPASMAESYCAGGGMHGDLALIEAAGSARAFLHLANLGVPFPQDRFGQFVGYKTDHDPRQRATSIGPYTSREMCRALIREVRRLRIPVRENRMAAALLTVGDGKGRRAAGAVALAGDSSIEVYAAENVVFAVGGPGGLYRASVYPAAHTGAIGLALMAGAAARGLPESQYGLASVRFRWNVSGTYMQVVPRFVSTAADGADDEREFLRPYFDSPGAMHSRVFLKGYQWPFDCRKIVGGSSLVDILVYIETVRKGRRVFLDFRRDPAEFRFDALSAEARAYLDNSGARLATPIARLRQMNPAALDLYREHGIDLAREPLEIAVCAQHNNGGLAANAWWESENIRHLFPVGEVNGSHGVCRPGGSALNAGQVGGFRLADFIAGRYAGWSLPRRAVVSAARTGAGELLRRLCAPSAGGRLWQAERQEFRERMTRAGAHIRSLPELRRAVREARRQCARLERAGAGRSAEETRESLRNRQLCFAHAVYLDAIRFAVESGVGSRGSALVLDPKGTPCHAKLAAAWSFAPEDPSFRQRVLETRPAARGKVRHRWAPCRPIPAGDAWFETAWAAYRSGAIYADGAGGGEGARQD